MDDSWPKQCAALLRARDDVFCPSRDWLECFCFGLNTCNSCDQIHDNPSSLNVWDGVPWLGALCEITLASISSPFGFVPQGTEAEILSYAHRIIDNVAFQDRYCAISKSYSRVPTGPSTGVETGTRTFYSLHRYVFNCRQPCSLPLPHSSPPTPLHTPQPTMEVIVAPAPVWLPTPTMVVTASPVSTPQRRA